MILAILCVCVVLCVGLGLSLGAALDRARRRVQKLEVALAAAREIQRSHDSVLTERSQLDTLKDEFISTVSHELRTPLTSIRGALGLLSAGLMGTVDAKAQNLLRIAATNTDRLIRLINDILDLERMQSGRAPLQVRRCSLRDLVQQSVEAMSGIAEAAAIKLEVKEIAPTEAVFFDGDSDRMLQVLTNLLSNAIKFSTGPSVVQIQIEADTDSILLRISDHGRGIPIDKLDAIFDRFQQVEASDGRQKGGTGLGLAICRTIVQQHNGTIWAESNPQHNRGPGASFVVSVPRTSRQQDAIASRPITLLPTPGEGTLIVCDDDAGIRTVVGENLRRHGYTILEASGGEQAIELAKTRQIGAILLDLMMPGMTGWETMQALRAFRGTAKIPVVVLSVLAPTSATGDASRAAASVQGWVQKPFNEHLLLAELARVLRAGKATARILLVTEDQALAAVMLSSFRDSEVRLVHVTTRKGAMESCERSRPDLVLLDLGLPDGNGLLLVDWLRKQTDLCSLPLMIYSGREVSETERMKLRLGPTKFLSRAEVEPQRGDELVGNIVQHMQESFSSSRG